MIATTTKYKKTGLDWMSEVPEHWEIQRLKTFVDFVNRGNTPNYVESAFHKVVNQATFSKGYFDESNIRYSDFGEKELKGKIFKNDILLASTGGGVLGKTYFFDLVEDNFVADSHVTILRDSQKRFVPEFLYYILSINYKLINGILAEGSTNQTELQKDWLLNLKIALPPLSEQDEIVQYIKAQEEKINLFIQKKQRFIELLKEQRQSVIESAITCKSGWTKSRIKNVARMFGRIGFRGYQTSDLVDEGEGAITISPSNMKHHKQMDFSNCSYLSWEKYEESPEIKIFEGDILMVKTGATYGKVAQVHGLPEKATINPQLMVFKEIILDNDYFFYFLQSGFIKEQMEKNVIGGTIPTITQTKIGGFRLHYPDIEEQIQIVSHIKAETATIDTAIAKAEREIELIREYKEAMIAEAVMGKRKL